MEKNRIIHPMDFEIVELNEFKVIGFKITCKDDKLFEEMPKLWIEFMHRLGEINNRIDDYVMDISLEVTGKDYTQCICAKVDSFDYIPKGMVGLTIGKQKYIHYKHKGPVNQIWMSFYNMQKWSEEKGYILDPMDFKIDSNIENNDNVHELYIRII